MIGQLGAMSEEDRRRQELVRLLAGQQQGGGASAALVQALTGRAPQAPPRTGPQVAEMSPEAMQRFRMNQANGVAPSNDMLGTMSPQQRQAAGDRMRGPQQNPNWTAPPYQGASDVRRQQMPGATAQPGMGSPQQMPQGLPDYRQREFQTMTPDERRRVLEQMGGQGMSPADAFNPQGFDPSNPDARFDDGRAYRVAQAGGDMMAAAPRGTFAGASVGSYQPSGDAVTQRRLEGNELDFRGAAARLRNIDQMLAENPNMIDSNLTWTGDMRRRFLRTKEKLGFDLDTEQTEYLADSAAFRQVVLRNVNRTIQEITGAAMGEEEAKRIRMEVPDVSASPTEFRAQLATAMNLVRRDIARLAIWRMKGQGAPIDISDAEVDQVLTNRGAQLYQEAVQSGMPPDQARLEAARRLSEEFGL